MTTSAVVPRPADAWVADDRGETATARAQKSGLVLAELPGNPGKLQLILDLARQLDAATRPVRVLDVGIGGRYRPFTLWEPFLRLRDRLDLVGIDVAHLEQTRARAAELGFPVRLVGAGANDVVDTFGAEAFDAVVSTQVLEHLPQWRDAVAQMAVALRPGGTLYVTCDSGDRATPLPTRVRLAAKRSYARGHGRMRSLDRLGNRFLSGDWEQGPRLEQVRAVLDQTGLSLEMLRHFGLRDAKTMQNRLDATGRLRWLDFELEIQPGDPALFLLLYLRAKRDDQLSGYVAGI